MLTAECFRDGTGQMSRTWDKAESEKGKNGSRGGGGRAARWVGKREDSMKLGAGGELVCTVTSLP